jgi:hypothetical protein
VKTYDPNRFVISFAGIILNKGVAEDTFLSVSKAGPGFSSKVSVDGSVTRSRSHDKRKIAKLTLMQSSEVNDRLSALYNADRDPAQPNGRGVGVFSVQDLSGTTVLRAAKAYIADDPDLDLGATAGPREWTFELSEVVNPIHGSISDD